MESLSVLEDMRNKKSNLLLSVTITFLLNPAISLAELAKFVDPLPIPQVAKPTTYNGSHYQITMKETAQKLHRDLPPATLWGYNGQYPGPTFKVRKGSPITVDWQNHLPKTHFLPQDPNLHGVRPDVPGGKAPPSVKTAIHLHGGKVLPASDGHPEGWFSPYNEEVGPNFVSSTYSYPNDQQAASLWYHDHSLGTTRLNVYAGLAGTYLIGDEAEDQLKLPSGRYDIPLIIQDRNIDLTTGQLIYPTQTITNDPEIRKIWVPEAFGDTVLVQR
jgi:spore coat protein A, manganese oxidase